MSQLSNVLDNSWIKAFRDDPKILFIFNFKNVLQLSRSENN
jgi:hypothetical protein